MLTLYSFSQFWGVFFILFTLYIFFFIDEEATTNPDNIKPSEEEKPLVSSPVTAEDHSSEADDLTHVKDESDLTISQTYRLYFDILKNPYVFLPADSDVVPPTRFNLTDESNRCISFRSGGNPSADR